MKKILVVQGKNNVLNYQEAQRVLVRGLDLQDSDVFDDTPAETRLEVQKRLKSRDYSFAFTDGTMLPHYIGATDRFSFSFLRTLADIGREDLYSLILLSGSEQKAQTLQRTVSRFDMGRVVIYPGDIETLIQELSKYRGFFGK